MKRTTKFFYYGYYVLTFLLILDFGSVLLYPIINGYPILIYWNYAFELNPLSWSLFIVILVTSVLIKKN